MDQAIAFGNEKKSNATGIPAATETPSCIVKTVTSPGESHFPAVNIIDSEGVVLFCDDRMKRLVGRDVTGEKCWEIFGLNEAMCDGCPLAVGVDEGETIGAELSGILDGRILRITHTGIMYDGQKAMLQVYDDITERRKREWDVARMQRLESIGMLSSGIAHDFNNLLGVIVGNVALAESIAGGDEELLKRIRVIGQAAERGSALVKQLLGFTRVKAPAFTPVSINRIVGDLSKMFEETFPKSLRLLCNQSEDLPMIKGDPTQIHQVLMNLMLNSRDAMAGGGDLILSTEPASLETVRKLFPAASAKEYVLVGVSDNGTGMSRNTLEHIFEPFFTTKGPSDGTGLGLSVVTGIMEQHHGFVNVRSEPGKGTTFSLYFPAYTGKNVTVSTPEQSDDNVDGGHETILIVEDEEMLNELLTTILKSKGYDVLRAWNGRQAVEIYRQNKNRVSLVVSDFGLPSLTGNEVLTWLKEVNPDVRFVLATGYIDPGERASLIENGTREIIMKPYRPADLLNKVRKVLDA